MRFVLMLALLLSTGCSASPAQGPKRAFKALRAMRSFRGGAPVTAQATAGTDPGSILVSWTPQDGALFIVQPIDSGGTFLPQQSLGGSSVLVSGLSSGASYTFAVFVQGQDGAQVRYAGPSAAIVAP